jgi:hypothetical protein
VSRTLWKVSTQIRGVFTVYDAANAGVTGLVDGNFTKRLTLNGANDATAVTVTEVANGRYTYTFTPGSTGHWHVWITNATYNLRGWTEDFDVTTDGAPSLSDITNDILTRTDGVETGFTVRRALRIIAAAAAGKVSGGPGSPVFRNMADTADQITGTADASGNRTAASYGA